MTAQGGYIIVIKRETWFFPVHKLWCSLFIFEIIGVMHREFAFFLEDKGGLCPFLVILSAWACWDFSRAADACWLGQETTQHWLCTSAQICETDNRVDLLFTKLRNLRFH